MKKKIERRIGVHVSSSGKIFETIDRALLIKCNTLQMFLSSPRTWSSKAISNEDIITFKKNRNASIISPIVVHSHYLINLASPDDQLYNKSIDSVISEILQADQLECDYYVIHPGSYRNSSEEEGIKRISSALNIVFKETKPKLSLLLENTSGSGNTLGKTFEQLAKIMENVDLIQNVGVCFDTCHGLASGYDIRESVELDKMFAKCEKLFDSDIIKVVHLNDSKGDLGSNLDRHTHIGDGKIGKEGFKAFLNHEKVLNYPLILETPKDTPEDDPRNLKIVYSLIIK